MKLGIIIDSLLTTGSIILVITAAIVVYAYIYLVYSITPYILLTYKENIGKIQAMKYSRMIMKGIDT